MPNTPVLQVSRKAPDIYVWGLKGNWIIGSSLPTVEDAFDRMQASNKLDRIEFDCTGLKGWDSQFLSFLIKLIKQCDYRGITMDTEGLPSGVKGMLDLAKAIPERQDIGTRNEPQRGLFNAIGRYSLDIYVDFLNLATFLGDTTLAFLKFCMGRARFRQEDLWRLIQDSGPSALPIISLISLLVGMILAFVGAVQLRLFGAQIFIADLVGLGMAREMGAMMTAILMAGRTGAAYAAELGSMTVNDEIDALRTSGFSPMEFLVIPRIVALVVTIPLLCLYSDILGMIGGALVAQGLFDISFSEFYIQLQNRIRPIDFEVGIVKCTVFGALVAIAGCMRGLQSKRSASAVGLATTSAVVTGIIFIVVSDAVMTLLVTSLNLFKR